MRERKEERHIHNLFSLFLFPAVKSGASNAQSERERERYFHFQLLPHKQKACEDNVVRNDEYIASGFNIFNTLCGCGVGESEGGAVY